MDCDDLQVSGELEVVGITLVVARAALDSSGKSEILLVNFARFELNAVFFAAAQGNRITQDRIGLFLTLENVNVPVELSFFVEESEGIFRRDEVVFVRDILDFFASLLGGDTARERSRYRANKRSEERRVGKECRSRWSPYH